MPVKAVSLGSSPLDTVWSVSPAKAGEQSRLYHPAVGAATVITPPHSIVIWEVREQWALALRYHDRKTQISAGGFIHSLDYGELEFNNSVNLLLKGMGHMLGQDPNFLWQGNRLSQVKAALTGINAEEGIRKRTESVSIRAIWLVLLGVSNVFLDRNINQCYRAVRFDVGRGLFYVYRTREKPLEGKPKFNSSVTELSDFPEIESMPETETLDMNAEKGAK